MPWIYTGNPKRELKDARYGFTWVWRKDKRSLEFYFGGTAFVFAWVRGDG